MVKGQSEAARNELFSSCRRLRKEGRTKEVAGLLTDALCRNLLDSEGVLHAGRILRQLDEMSASHGAYRVAILGQCTTSWMVPALTAVACGRGQRLQIEEADFDNVLQGLSSLDPAIDAVVLVPWSQRLLADSHRSGSQRIEDELNFWQSAWSMAAGRGDMHLIQVGYDWVDAGAGGHYLGGNVGGDVDLVRQLNKLLREHLPTGRYFVDLEQVSGTIGRHRFYDPRRYFWTKQPFSDDGIVRLAEHLWSGLRATLTGPKKVLVLDLDNTLWGGVVGQ